MSAIRVASLPDRIKDGDIKKTFSKPEHGGGPIEKIYFPLFKNEAVVVFKNEHTAQMCATHDHTMMEEDVYVTELPKTQAFSSLEATLDPDVTSFLEATDERRDVLQYGADLQYRHDDNTGISYLRGNWYQLEWAWKFIDDIITSQQFLQERVAFRASYDTKHDDTGEEKERETTPGADSSIITVSGESKTSSTDKPDEAQVPRPKSKQVKQVTKVNVSAQMRTSLLRTKEEETPRGSVKDDKKTTKPKLNPSPDLDKKIESSSGMDKSPIVNDKPGCVMSLEFICNRLHVKVYNGDITYAETDTIVNAAMGNLINGGGVAYAIARAASPKMQDECDEYVKRHGPVPVSGAIYTCAGGRLSDKVQYVVHTVGPLWSTYPDTEKDLCANQLTKTFLNTMIYCGKELNLKTVTFPVISSGIFGVPMDTCLRAFLDAVLLCADEENSTLQEVHLVQRFEEDSAITVLTLRELVENGLDHLHTAAQENFRKLSLRTQAERDDKKKTSLKSFLSSFTKD